LLEVLPNKVNIFATISLCSNQARKQGEHWGHFPPLKISKHCAAILTFAKTFKEYRWNLYSNHFEEVLFEFLPKTFVWIPKLYYGWI